MPTISMFYGIIIYMYFMDNKEHNLPHIHTKYQEFEAVFELEDGNLIKGDFPKNKTKLVQAWIELHRDELKANWELAVSGNQIYQIEPLK